MTLKHSRLIESIYFFVLSRLVFGIENNALIRLSMLKGKKIVGLLNQWDSLWYINIIKHGYMLVPLSQPPELAGQADWAFFPLFPLSAKVLYWCGIPADWAGIVVNQIAFFLCIWLFIRLMEKLVNYKQALFTTLIFAITPFNIFISASYSDTVFLLFSLLAFTNLQQEKYWLAALSGAFLSASRFFGILFLASYAYNVFLRKKQIPNLKIIIQLLIISSGLLLFMLYLHYQAGDALAFYHIQKAWGHTGVDWLSNPVRALSVTFMSGNTYAKWFFILAFVWIPYLVYKKFYEYALFAGLSLLAPVVLGTLWSFTRYSLSMFMFYIVIGLVTQKSQSLRYVVLIITLVLHFAFYMLWMTGDVAVI